MSFVEGRRGPRTLEQKRREILRGATRKATDKFSLGGNLKKGQYAPKPVTLPKIVMPDAEGGA